MTINLSIIYINKSTIIILYHLNFPSESINVLFSTMPHQDILDHLNIILFGLLFGSSLVAAPVPRGAGLMNIGSPWR